MNENEIKWDELTEPIHVGLGPELVNAPEEFKDPYLYIEITIGNTESNMTLNEALRSAFKKFLARTTDIDEDTFDKSPFNSRMLDFLVNDYMRCHGDIKANNMARFINRAINRFVAIRLRKLNEDLMGLESYNPPIVLTSCPRFINHKLDYENDEYKGQYVVELVSELSNIQQLRKQLDEGIINKISSDWYDYELSDADLRKRIKHAKSYQERRHYQQLLSGKTSNDKKYTKKKHKKK